MNPADCFAHQLGFPSLPDAKPEGEALENEQTMRDLHRMLLETHVSEGKLVCGNCNHAYMIKEGIANFLLPSHLGESYSLVRFARKGRSLMSSSLSKTPTYF